MRRLKTCLVVALVGGACFAQAPAGRWDGTMTMGTLKVPFQLQFEGKGGQIAGSFVNGDAHVTSTAGTFADGKLNLEFGGMAGKLEATLEGGELKGVYARGAEQYRFKAAAFCTCGFQGEAGPAIMGDWQVPGEDWRLKVDRKSDDTLVTVTRPGDQVGPLMGRFDGAGWLLQYFDGQRGAVLEIELRKDDTLDLVWRTPGEAPKKMKAQRVQG